MGSPAAATAPKGGATWRSGPPASLQRRLSSAAASSTDTRASTRPLHIVVTCLPASSRGIVVLRLLDVGKARRVPGPLRRDRQAGGTASVARSPRMSRRLASRSKMLKPHPHLRRVGLHFFLGADLVTG